MQKQRVVIIGGGIGGLGTACLLAKDGYAVTLIEKNEQLGGRASVFEAKGFRFDMGPSWYLMPDVFERFFNEININLADHVDLIKLKPSYRVFFKDAASGPSPIDLYSDVKRDAQTFEAIEPGAAGQLKKYLDRAAYVYDTAVNQFLYKNYDKFSDFMSPKLLKEVHRLSLTSNMDRYVRRYFKDYRLQQVMEYPLVFLGSSPFNAPALYNLMSHVDFNQGVFYPQGGIYEIIKILESTAKQLGVKVVLNAPAEKIITAKGKVTAVRAGSKTYPADIVVSNADPYHTETALLAPNERDHSPAYWRKRVLAPSALLIYLGVKGKLPSLTHHNLLFSKNWQQNFKEIFDTPQFPSDPSLYVSKPSTTDPSVAPKGHENVCVLVPLAAGLTYTDAQLEKYADHMLATIETEMGAVNLRRNIVYKRLFCVKDFENRYNSLQGTGLGLAHTLRQTALFRPSNVSKKVKNLYYVGANVHPGIGMPVCLISAQLAAERIRQHPIAL